MPPILHIWCADMVPPPTTIFAKPPYKGYNNGLEAQTTAYCSAAELVHNPEPDIRTNVAKVRNVLHSCGSERDVVTCRYEPRNDFFRACLFERDLELVAFDANDGTIAKFLVEHPLSNHKAGDRVKIDHRVTAF